MGRKRVAREIGGSKVYLPWKEWSEGCEVIGKLTGSSLDNYDKTNWHIHVEECNFDDDLVGKTLALNHCGSVAYKMESVNIGEVVGFEMLGEVEITKGKHQGSMAHDIKVTVYDDEGNTEELEDKGGAGTANAVEGIL